MNAQLLDEKIEKSGLKKKFIYDSLGISHTAFDKKQKGITPFRKSEIFTLCHLLDLSDSDRKYIFSEDG